MATEKILIFDEAGNAKRMKVRIARFLDNEPVTASDKTNIRTTLDVDDSLSGTFTTPLSVTSASDSSFTGGGKVGIGVSPSNPLDVSAGNSATFSVLGEGTHSLVCGNTNTNSGADLRLYSKDEIRFNTGSTASGDTRWSINSSGALVSSGGGIDFGSTTTGSGTVTGGLLDDYEEGTFTPVFADANSGGNTATVLDAQGVYTKIGRVVSFSILLTNIDTTGLTSGNSARIRGLPFDFGQSNVRWSGTVRLDNVTFTGYVTSNGVTNQDVLSLNASRSGTTDDNLLVSAFTSSSADVFVTGTYQVG